MSLYDNEENAIVNNDNDVSETPSNLVNESPDQEYNKNGAKLSPNPAGFGFIKQLFVTPENTATNGEPNLPGEPNVLYLVQVLNNGVLVGYRKYKWTPSDGFVQFGATPDLKLKDSPRETPTRVENEPKKNLAQVFNGDIAVNGDLFVKGQKVQGSSDPLTPSQVVDIVNEGIEGGDINVVANPTLAGTEDPLTGLQIGDTKYAVGGGVKFYLHILHPSNGFNGVRKNTLNIENGSASWVSETENENYSYLSVFLVSTRKTAYANFNEVMDDFTNKKIISYDLTGLHGNDGLLDGYRFLRLNFERPSGQGRFSCFFVEIQSTGFVLHYVYGTGKISSYTPHEYTNA